MNKKLNTNEMIEKIRLDLKKNKKHITNIKGVLEDMELILNSVEIFYYYSNLEENKNKIKRKNLDNAIKQALIIDFNHIKAIDLLEKFYNNNITIMKMMKFVLQENDRNGYYLENNDSNKKGKKGIWKKILGLINMNWIYIRK